MLTSLGLYATICILKKRQSVLKRWLSTRRSIGVNVPARLSPAETNLLRRERAQGQKPQCPECPTSECCTTVHSVRATRSVTVRDCADLQYYLAALQHLEAVFCNTDAQTVSSLLRTRDAQRSHCRFNAIHLLLVNARSKFQALQWMHACTRRLLVASTSLNIRVIRIQIPPSYFNPDQVARRCCHLAACSVDVSAKES